MNGQVQQFATAPQAVGARQNKRYRDPEPDTTIGGKTNLMHDKRVVRGNTYASVVEPSKQPDAAEAQRQRDAQRRRLMRANQTGKRPGTPEAVPGRKHMDIQTDSYLEELTERTVEFEAETQTDFLLDRPPSPLFMPAKIGIDVETQIEEGELFNFDVESEPVLEVLVGKTLEQSMMEVLEEEELESLRRHQEDFEKRRNQELLEVQRMEAAEQRRSDEMRRRMQQQADEREVDVSVMKKVLSRSIATAHMSSLKHRALVHLADAGVFAEATQIGVESTFLPNLLQKVTQQVERNTIHHQLAGQMMQTPMLQRMDTHQKKLDTEKRRLAVIDQAERQARDEKKVDALKREEEQKRLEQEKEALLDWEATQPPEAQWAVVALALEDAVALVLGEGHDGEKRIDLNLLAPEGKAVEEDPPAKKTVLLDGASLEELQILLRTDLTTLPGEAKLLCKFFEGSGDKNSDGRAEAFKFAIFSAEVPPPPEDSAELLADGIALAPQGWMWVQPTVAGP